MKIPFIGPSSEARSLTSDAQRSINMYTESGGTKSPKGFYGKPGLRARKTLAGIGTCLASVNDRLFCTVANTLIEIDPNFNTAQTASGGGFQTSSTPVSQRDRIILNGLPRHLQALVIGNGDAYYWNDLETVMHPIYVGDTKQLSGRCDIDGTSVHNNGTPYGEPFKTVMANQAIWINGTAYVVDNVTSDTDLTLQTAASQLSNADWLAYPILQGKVDTEAYMVHNNGPETGDLFDPLMASQPITINGTQYVIERVDGPWDLTLTTQAPIQKAVSWSGTIHLAGKCDLNGIYVHNDPPLTGDLFPSWLEGGTITIGGSTYTVTQVVGPYDLTINPAGPSNWAQYFTATSPPLLAGKCDTDGIAVHNNGPESLLDKDGNPDADLFDTVSMGGQTITINGAPYTVDYVQSPWDLLLQPPGAPVQRGVDWQADHLLLQASSACEVGGYGIVTRPNSRQFNVSGLNDFSSWDPLDFALKEGSTDNLVGSAAHRGELWLFGRENIEVWDLSGNPDFPFAKNQSGSIARGLGGPQTLCKVGEQMLCFIGENGVAYRTQGYSIVRISTPSQENDWRNAFTIAIAFAFEMAGHLFWQVNLDTKSWVWDATESEWTERGLLNTVSGNTFYREIAQFHDYIPDWNGVRDINDEGATQGSHIVTGYNDHNLYELSTDFHDDNGVAIRYVRRFPHLVNEKLRIFLHKLTFEVETGQVVSGDPEPQMELRISADGGKTWRQSVTSGGDLIVTTGFGLNGDTRKRLIFRRLGSGRDLVPEIAVTMKSKLYIADAYGEVTPGNA